MIRSFRSFLRSDVFAAAAILLLVAEELFARQIILLVATYHGWVSDAEIAQIPQVISFIRCAAWIVGIVVSLLLTVMSVNPRDGFCKVACRFATLSIALVASVPAAVVAISFADLAVGIVTVAMTPIATAVAAAFSSIPGAVYAALIGVAVLGLRRYCRRFRAV